MAIAQGSVTTVAFAETFTLHEMNHSAQVTVPRRVAQHTAFAPETRVFAFYDAEDEAVEYRCEKDEIFEDEGHYLDDLKVRDVGGGSFALTVPSTLISHGVFEAGDEFTLVLDKAARALRYQPAENADIF